MNGNHRTGFSDRVTRVAAREFSRVGRSSHSSGRKQKDKDSQEAETRGFKGIGVASERLGFNSVIQNASMSFSAFVETKFIPEHVQHKTLAGRTHYQAMLKHLISPEIVHRMFNAEGVSKARLHSVPGWPYLDQVRLCDLTPEHVRSLVAAAFARNYAWQTVKHIKNAAFAIIAHAQQEGCFHRLNPGSHVKLPPRAHRSKPDLTMNQARAILQLLPSPEKDVAFLTLSTGMNIQEICNLQWKHVNVADSPRVLEGEIIPPYCIAVRAHWNPSGVGNASARRNRNVVLSARLFAVLADWALEKRALNPEEFVLVSDSGQPVLRANLRSSRLVTAGRKLGVPWLSWRVLCRAHLGNLSEFRPQLDHMIGTTRLSGSAVSPQRKQDDLSVFTQNRI